jgi:cation transport ATPase
MERGQYQALLHALADIVRPESRVAVAQLKKLGISPIMLTGDAEGVTKAVSDTARSEGRKDQATA